MHSRVLGLDILRAFAILAVLQSHAYFLIATHVDEHLYDALGIDGVTLFFVLSGFLIGRILLKKLRGTPFARQDLTDFWLRRWMRTLPAYYAVLAVLALRAALTEGTASLRQYLP